VCSMAVGCFQDFSQPVSVLISGSWAFSIFATMSLSWASEARPRDYGAFAPEILEIARSGDARAREIVGEAANAIATLAKTLHALGAEQIALAGGFGEPLRPFLPPDVAKLLSRPRRDAVDGAILLAGGTLAEDA